ncbi:hypothetical protein MKEN_01123900 [Mycena kentingensis (nom. inval.)]|nr:hypothetical protein MKEN_01123900 [Mycena kentingensis (nom. inval.)]
MLPSLPQELVDRIASNLGDEDLRSTARVSRALRAASQRLLFRTIILPIGKSRDAIRLFDVFGVNPLLAGYTRKLILRINGQKPASTWVPLLEALFAQLNRITYLGIVAAGEKPFLPAMHTLLAKILHPSIRDLTLGEIQFTTPDQFLALLRGCPRLCSVRMDGCKLEEGDAPPPAIDEILPPNIETLAIAGPSFVEPDGAILDLLRGAVNVSELKHLEVHLTQNIRARIQQYLDASPAIEGCEIFHVPSYLPADADIYALSLHTQRSLTYLGISGFLAADPDSDAVAGLRVLVDTIATLPGPCALTQLNITLRTAHPVNETQLAQWTALQEILLSKTRMPQFVLFTLAVHANGFEGRDFAAEGTKYLAALARLRDKGAFRFMVRRGYDLQEIN